MAAPLVAARLGDGYRVEVVAADGEVGSGAVPVVPLPSRALAIDHPDVPADRVVALRQAFMNAMKDPDLLAEAQRIGLAIDPISGEDLQKLAADIFATPVPFVEKVKDALVYRAP